MPSNKALGTCIADSKTIVRKLGRIRALIFDWDGVFHSGRKNGDGESTFSEVDSMGVNMVRFAYYLKNGSIPYTAIVTGEDNRTAHYFAKREHFDHVFYKIKNKVEMLDWLKENKGFANEEVLFVFDDILDLSVARICGLRFLVEQEASFMFKQYCIDNHLCDYISKNNANNHAVREIAELILSLLGVYNKVIEKRIAYATEYTDYYSDRNSLETVIATLKDGEMHLKK